MQRVQLFQLFLALVAGSLSILASTQTLNDQPTPVLHQKIFLLGEIHDNPHGHQSRLELVRQLIEEGNRPTVIMEQFDRDNLDILITALVSCLDVDCVLAKAATPGWEWSHYRPFVQLALEQKITLMAGNLSNADVRKVMTQGFSVVFNPQTLERYQLHRIPPVIQSAQNQAIEEGHCNKLPSQVVGPMVRGQIARDVWMADLINKTDHPMVILIAGNGHVRKDVGVFQWLSEDKQRMAHVRGYVEKADKSHVNWFDALQVVPEFAREDPCLRLKSTPSPR